MIFICRWPLRLRYKENSSPRCRGSKSQNFKSPICGDYKSLYDGIFVLGLSLIETNTYIHVFHEFELKHTVRFDNQICKQHANSSISTRDKFSFFPTVCLMLIFIDSPSVHWLAEICFLHQSCRRNTYFATTQTFLSFVWVFLSLFFLLSGCKKNWCLKLVFNICTQSRHCPGVLRYDPAVTPDSPA